MEYNARVGNLIEHEGEAEGCMWLRTSALSIQHVVGVG